MHLLILMLFWIITAGSDAQKPDDTLSAIGSAAKRVTWSSEVDYEFKPLFIAKKAGQSLPQLLTAWAGTIKNGPACTECIEATEFNGFIEDQVGLIGADHPSLAKSLHDVAREEIERWRALAGVIQQRLTNVAAYIVGNEDDHTKLVVLCGYDRDGNVIGCWAKHISD